MRQLEDKLFAFVQEMLSLAHRTEWIVIAPLKAGLGILIVVVQNIVALSLTTQLVIWDFSFNLSTGGFMRGQSV